jgi:hypothetical protein
MEKFSARFRVLVPAELLRYLDMFEQGGAETHRIAPTISTPFQPKGLSPGALHNHYVDLLLSAYTAKHALYSNQLILGVNRLDFLAYASAARGFVEMTAILRDYVVRKYKPLFDAGLRTGNVDLRQVISLHDQHLRGSRFDWDAWLSGNLGALFAEAQKRHSKKSDERVADSIRKKQVNVTTCVQKWAAEAPAVLVLYDLLCDFVHPNMGSNLAVASVENEHLVFGSINANVAAITVFVQTFPWLLSVCGKSFGEHITMLALSRYQPDELGAV